MYSRDYSGIFDRSGGANRITIPDIELSYTNPVRNERGDDYLRKESEIIGAPYSLREQQTRWNDMQDMIDMKLQREFEKRDMMKSSYTNNPVDNAQCIDNTYKNNMEGQYDWEKIVIWILIVVLMIAIIIAVVVSIFGIVALSRAQRQIIPGGYRVYPN